MGKPIRYYLSLCANHSKQTGNPYNKDLPSSVLVDRKTSCSFINDIKEFDT